MIPLTTWVAAGVAVACLALAGLQTLRLGAEQTAHANTKAAHAETLRGLADQARQVAERVTQAQQAWDVARAANEAARTKEKADAVRQIETLRADVARGERRLHVRAVCPAPRPADGVPASASAARVDDAAAPELAPEARQDYFDLLNDIATVQAQVAGLQEHIRASCLGPPL